MAFITFQDKESERAALNPLLGMGFTVLQGKDDTSVYAVQEIMLDELDEAGISYALIPLANVGMHLSERGAEYLDNLIQNGGIFQNMSLPPANHLVLSIPVDPAYEKAARDLLSEYNPVQIETKELTRMNIFADADDELQELLEVICTVDRIHKDEIIKRLIDEEISGLSRSRMILVLSDPDGPPRNP